MKQNKNIVKLLSLLIGLDACERGRNEVAAQPTVRKALEKASEVDILWLAEELMWQRVSLPPGAKAVYEKQKNKARQIPATHGYSAEGYHKQFEYLASHARRFIEKWLVMHKLLAKLS